MELYESILRQLKEQAENTELGTSLDDSTFDTEEFQLAALKAAARKLEHLIKYSRLRRLRLFRSRTKIQMNRNRRLLTMRE